MITKMVTLPYTLAVDISRFVVRRLFIDTEILLAIEQGKEIGAERGYQDGWKVGYEQGFDNGYMQAVCDKLVFDRD